MVSPDGWITMQVHPEVSSVSSALDAGPRITTREADAVVRVRDGQTIIIGGLINRKDDETQGGIPILKDIPLLGGLFSKRSQDKENLELTVFITPYIIKHEEQIQVGQYLFNEEFHLNLDNRLETEQIRQLVETVKKLDLSEVNKNGKSTIKLLNEKQEIIRAYEYILSNYPDYYENDYILYRLALIYATDFNEQTKAQELLRQLVKEYPKSPYHQRAVNLLDQNGSNLEFEAIHQYRESVLLNENLKDQ